MPRLRKSIKEEASRMYPILKDRYELLGINLTQALTLFLKEKDINTLTVYYRVKEFDSYLEKIDRKKYKNPLEEIEDFCGIRIICYYQSDVKKIADLIDKEFQVLGSQDKEELLNADQFGYRSTHFIVKIKTEWLEAPNYRGLENFKAEIQVRTILMHAWAEIQHKLAYKKESHIHQPFKRKLSRISAKLEEADEQFEELRNSITDYKKDVKEIADSATLSANKIDLNLDSLQAFLDTTFPDRTKDIEDTSELVDEFMEYNITISELAFAYERVKKFFVEFEYEQHPSDEKGTKVWSQAGAARATMDLTHKKYFEDRSFEGDITTSIDKKWRSLIEQEFHF